MSPDRLPTSAHLKIFQLPYKQKTAFEFYVRIGLESGQLLFGHYVLGRIARDDGHHDKNYHRILGTSDPYKSDDAYRYPPICF